MVDRVKEVDNKSSQSAENNGLSSQSIEFLKDGRNITATPNTNQDADNDTVTPSTEQTPCVEKKSASSLAFGNIWENFNASGVKQGQNGDCYFEAAVASMANSKKGREQLQSMIKTNDDGSYTVTFPGAKDNPINVKPQELDERNTRSDEANWARIIETAGLKYNNDTPITASMDRKEGIAVLGRNSTPRGAMKLLTGQDEATDQTGYFSPGIEQFLSFGNTSKENIGRNVKEALNNGNPVTADVSKDFLKWLGGNATGPMPECHVYSVTGYDPKTGTVMVRNPWGQMDGTQIPNRGDTKDGVTNVGDGYMSMSLDTFYNRFSNVEIGNKSSYRNAGENIVASLGDVGTDAGKWAKDLFTGEIGSVPRDMINTLEQSTNVMGETTYAASSSVWHGVMDNPLVLINPGLAVAHATGLLPKPADVFTTADNAGKSVVDFVENLF